MPDLLSTLKAATQQEHQQLEDRLDLFNRVQNLEHYQTLLGSFYTIYDPLEHTVGMAVDWATAGWDYAADRKVPWLESDLQHFGETSASLTAMPRCASLPSPTGLAAAIGCLYVMEGSTLGGQVISSRFRKQLGITPEAGGRFFSGYGESTVPHWRQFGAWVRSVEEQLDTEAAVNSARQTFQSFDGWLNSPRLP